MVTIDCADCLDWLPQLPEGCADLVVADPPYNIGLDYGEGSPRDDLPPWQFLAWCERWVRLCRRALRPGGHLYVVVSRHWLRLGVLMEDQGLLVRPVIWRESFGTYQKTSWANEFRFVFEGWKPGKGLVWNDGDVRVPSKRQEMGDRRADPAGRVPGDVWDFSRVCGTFKERVEGVPTQLPEKLVGRIVLARTDPGGLVVEPFAGSGTAAAVCKKLGRDYRGCDINPRYVEIARRRVENS